MTPSASSAVHGELLAGAPRRRILHVIEELAWHGGVPQKLLHLLRHTSGQLGHEFVILNPGSMDKEFEEAGAILHASTSTRVDHVAREIRAAAQRNRPDVIFSHSNRALLCSTWVAASLGIPVMHGAHGLTPAMQNLDVRARLSKWPIRLCAKRVAAVIANSRFTADSFSRAFEVPDSALHVLYPPVEKRTDVNFAESAALPPRRAGVRRLVSIGGLIPIRDHGTLICTIRYLADRGVEAELLIVGSGAAEQSLRERSREMRVEDRVHWLGYRRNIASVLESSDVYVSATVAEGFGIAVIEAMLHGLPVVLADAGSHPELIVDGRTGMLFQPRNPQDLAQQLYRLLSDEDLYSRLSVEGKISTQHRFSAQRFAVNLVAIVDQLCKG